MRRFGVDKPELMEFQLGDNEKVYTLPLAASMPATLILEMSESSKKGEEELFRFQVEMLSRYIGDAVDELTAGDIRNILLAWQAESTGQGAEVGES